MALKECFLGRNRLSFSVFPLRCFFAKSALTPLGSVDVSPEVYIKELAIGAVALRCAVLRCDRNVDRQICKAITGVALHDVCVSTEVRSLFFSLDVQLSSFFTG